MTAFFSIGTFFAIFIGILLFTKKGKALPDKILAVWMLVIGLHLLAYHLHYLGYWATYPHLFGTTALFPLLHAPMLFLYTSYSLNGKQKFSAKDFLHFSPALLSYIYLFRVFFFYSVEEKILLDNGEIDGTWFEGIVLTVLVISVIIYTVLSFYLLKKYHKKMNTNFSFHENINLKWLQYWVMGFAVVFSVLVFVVVSRNLLDIDFGFNIDLVLYGTVILLVLSLGYFGIRHQGIFTERIQVIKEKQEEKYQKSALSEPKAKAINDLLLQVMKEEKPYLNPKLTLSELAKMTNTTANNLSQVINQFQEVNFFDFVNKYRIEEFKKLALEKPYFNILALAYEAGFNSKSSFNNLFKKFTHQTPSQYIKSTKTLEM